LVIYLLFNIYYVVMSRAIAKVYFKDWTILHWIYNWTCDIYIPKLYKTTDNVWEEFYRNYKEDIDVWYDYTYEWWEECVLYNDYWNGNYYIWKASKEDMKINCNNLMIYWDDKYYMEEITKEEAEKFIWYIIE